MHKRTAVGWVPEQPRLHSETPPQQNKETNKQKWTYDLDFIKEDTQMANQRMKDIRHYLSSGNCRGDQP